MSITDITIGTAADGATFGACLALPPTTGSAPGIVVLPPIFGIDVQLRGVTERYAARGYVVLTLNQFWRDPEPQVFARSEDERARALARAARVDVDQLVGDVRTAIATLRARPDCNGRIAVAGFCFGGRYAFLAAARLGIDAAATFHGTQIGLSLADAPNVKAPLSMHFGGDDPLTPPSEIEAIRAALRHRDDAEIFVYPGAGHNFSLPGVPGYDPAVAELSERRAFTVFDRLK